MNNINKSLELFKEAELLMPGGVNSPVRAFKNINGNPIFLKKLKELIYMMLMVMSILTTLGHGGQ